MSAGNPNAPIRIPARIARLTTLSRMSPKNALTSPGAAQRYGPNDPVGALRDSEDEACTRSPVESGSRPAGTDTSGHLVPTIAMSRQGRSDTPLAEERARVQNERERLRGGLPVLQLRGWCLGLAAV